MKFRMFRWMENPEEFGIWAFCEPEYVENDHGGYDYTGMSPMGRVFTGKGVFCGPEAVQQFNALAVLLATRVGGELVHPVWGTTTACLTELKMSQESRPDYIIYSFTFRETDENGSIPRLPEQKE
jgi:prophage DNA circulation protein